MSIAFTARFGVVELDGTAIGGGTPGKVAARMREIYLEEMHKAAV